MSVRYRQFAAGEAETSGRLFAATFNDLLAQRGLPPYVDLSDPRAWAAAWQRDRRSLFEHLTATGSASWLAEDGERAVGYARAGPPLSPRQGMPITVNSTVSTSPCLPEG